MLASYLLGIAVIVGLMLGWAAVQTAWSKAFPEAAADVDVLAHRSCCHGCRRSTACAGKLDDVSTKEKAR